MQPQFSFGVSVPGSSANLGSGYDSVGIALDLRMRAWIEPATIFDVRFQIGAHAPTHDGLREAIIAAIRRVNPTLPRVAIRIENPIPLGKGLGSSAAAAVLGLVIGARTAGVALSRERLAALAAAIEGHPENALACVFGGAIVAAAGNRLDYVRLPMRHELRALIVTPQLEFGTAHARGLLPETYSSNDALYTTQRAALLGATLASGSWKALRAAMGDRLHQPFRAAQIPGMVAALGLPSRAALGVAISGAGPSLLALFRPGVDWKPTARAYEACFARDGVAASSLYLGVGGRGISVVPTSPQHRAA